MSAHTPKIFKIIGTTANTAAKIYNTYGGTQNSLLGLLFFMHTFLSNKNELSPENTMKIFYGIIGAGALAATLQMPKILTDQHFIHAIDEAQKLWLNSEPLVKSDISILATNIQTLLEAVKIYTKHKDISKLLQYTELRSVNAVENLQARTTQLALPKRQTLLRSGAHAVAGLAEIPLNFLHFANVLIFMVLTIKLLGTGVSDVAWKVVAGLAALAGFIGFGLGINQQYGNYKEPIVNYDNLVQEIAESNTKINDMCNENEQLANSLKQIVEQNRSKLSAQQFKQLNEWIKERRVALGQVSTISIRSINQSSARLSEHEDERQRLLQGSSSGLSTYSLNP